MLAAKEMSGRASTGLSHSELMKAVVCGALSAWHSFGGGWAILGEAEQVLRSFNAQAARLLMPKLPGYSCPSCQAALALVSSRPASPLAFLLG